MDIGAIVGALKGLKDVKGGGGKAPKEEFVPKLTSKHPTHRATLQRNEDFQLQMDELNKPFIK